MGSPLETATAGSAHQAELFQLSNVHLTSQCQPQSLFWCETCAVVMHVRLQEDSELGCLYESMAAAAAAYYTALAAKQATRRGRRDSGDWGPAAAGASPFTRSSAPLTPWDTPPADIADNR